jgi:hypothetical protein
MKHTITISKDGKSSLKTEYGSSRGYLQKDLGDIGVDVEVIDLREKKLPVGQPAWAVVNKEGDIVDLHTHEVKRENLVLYDTEQIVEGVFTRNDTTLPSREAVEKAMEQTTIDQQITLERARIIGEAEKKKLDPIKFQKVEGVWIQDVDSYNQALIDIINIIKGKK